MYVCGCGCKFEHAVEFHKNRPWPDCLIQEHCLSFCFLYIFFIIMVYYSQADQICLVFFIHLHKRTHNRKELGFLDKCNTMVFKEVLIGISRIRCLLGFFSASPLSIDFLFLLTANGDNGRVKIAFVLFTFLVLWFLLCLWVIYNF